MAKTFCLAPARNAVNALLQGKGRHHANRGLVWERYLPIWDEQPVQPQRVDFLQPELTTFAEQFPYPENHLAERAQRIERALRHIERPYRLFVTREFELMWRLACGLGNDHPTGNGFAFDTLTGAPYLAGSAVKGLCRQAAAFIGWPSMQIEQLFGPDRITANEPARQGDLIFFDAFPRQWPKLSVDVINNHHPDYYARTSNVPRETDSPRPAFFLTVKGGAVEDVVSFVFSIGANSKEQLDSAVILLQEGLGRLGIGAKTAVGYGVFKATSTPGSPVVSVQKSQTSDSYETFRKWFDGQGYARGQKRGELDQIPKRLARLVVDQREVAIRYFEAQMHKTLTASDLQKWLDKLRAAGT
ncbi:CRISPR-associated protein Cmr6 [Solimonas aquatica]|uniref:CRISPR-associated protein Cmr6 n=1 Tax=Solimonas aquatica TaxID=489703 RepID=A0A1H9M8T1_9GAMM|nr:type III-B CRISPR module RAMP protein Cmr6 [Solimonas aquatica]SER20042.1 CRISPR-associated protein Cmr6 [Solimonas aquatica]